MQNFSTELSIGFGTLEAVLSGYQRISDEKRTAFQARLKNFHRLGFPSDLKSVKGKPTQYAPHHLLLMALAVELSQLGMSPERVTRLITENLAHVAIATSYSVKELLKFPKGFSVGQRKNPKSFFLCSDPLALQNLMGPLQIHEDMFFYSEEASLSDRIIDFTIGTSTRLAVINTTSLLDFIAPPDDDREPFLRLLSDWAGSQPPFKQRR